MCTMKFMEAVREGSVWCPKRDDIDKPIVVVTPPPQDVLSSEIVLILEEGIRSKANDSLFNPKPVQNLVDLLKKKKADTQWLLELLYVLNRNHGVFAPDYLYIKPRRTPLNQAAGPRMVSNSDNFFEGLPQVASKKGKRNSTFRVTKAERQ